MATTGVVYADGNNNGVIEPTEILEEHHYYPFGLEHQNYSTITGNTGYKYTFGGKEFQPEKDMNMYDFGARNYDPALGRWMNIDPLAENSRRWTQYNYAYNNPIYFIDPDGMQSWSFSGQAAVNFAKDLQMMLALNDGAEVETNTRIKPNQVVDKKRTDNNIIVSDDSNVKNGINDQKLVVDNGYDKEGNQINNNGGDTTDYMYDKEGNIISSTSVSNRFLNFTLEEK